MKDSGDLANRWECFQKCVFNGRQHPTHSSVAETPERFPDVPMGNNSLGRYEPDTGATTVPMFLGSPALS